MDLWPEITGSLPIVNSPILLCDEQMQLLKGKTGGLVIAEVKQSQIKRSLDIAKYEPNWFDVAPEAIKIDGLVVKDWHHVRYSLVAPRLNHYSIDLIQLLQDPSGYPAIVKSEFLSSPEGLQCNTEKEFVAILESILRHDRLQAILSNMIRMSHGNDFSRSVGPKVKAPSKKSHM